MAIEAEIRERAQDLFVIDGMTLEAVADEMGVAARTLANWSSEGGWAEKRREYRSASSGIRYNTVLLRKRLIDKALESLDPQDIYAAVRLENAAQKGERKNEPGVADIDRPRIFLEDMEFIAETLKEIDPEGLKVLARSFEIIVARFKEKHEKAKEGRHEA